jgi:nitroreductase/NAD-dependent dihydropyrimidine dehydrogenase PreA subunit
MQGGSAVPDIVVNEERCTRCGACVAVCAEARVFEMTKRAAEAVRSDDCWLCGHCVAVCPVDAVEHEAYPLEACPVIEAPPSYEQLVTALRERRSLRVFRDEPVPRETVRQLVDVSRWAPSASNAQAVDWIALDDPARIARLSGEVVATLGRLARLLQNRLLRPFLKLVLGRRNVEKAVESADEFDRLAEAAARGEDPIFHHAPVVLMAHVPEASYFGRDDAVYAAYNVMLVAERLGLGTCHIGYVNVALERSNEVAGIVGLPPERQIEVAMTLGYPRYSFRRALPRRRMELVWNPSA